MVLCRQVINQHKGTHDWKDTFTQNNSIYRIKPRKANYTFLSEISRIDQTGNKSARKSNEQTD